MEHSDPTDVPGQSTAIAALHGIRVVDLSTGPTGGLATMALADFGADVIKVEHSLGDRFRELPSAPMWLRGKRSVVLDLAAPTDREQLRHLAVSADVVIISCSPSAARRRGIAFEDVKAMNPAVVYASITGWGPAGGLADVPGYDGVAAALGGRMMLFERQLNTGRPVFAAVPLATHVASQAALQGVLAALIARSRGHAGAQHVETSLLQGLIPFELAELVITEVASRSGITLPSMQSVGGMLPTLNYHPVRTADGKWVQFGNLLEHLFIACLGAMDLLGDLLIDDRFSDPPSNWSPEAVEHARRAIVDRALTKTAAEWMEIFRADGGVAAEIIGSTQDGLRHVDVVAEGDVVEIEDPNLGTVLTLGPLAELSLTPARIERPAPRIGEHTDEILSSLPSAATPGGERPVQNSSSTAGPLAGVTVVEFASIIAAPLATTFLADLGARVIRVEPIDGDPYRAISPNGTGAAKTTAGKESICVDLKQAEGRDIARRLVDRCDVLVHNFRPGVPERLGLGEVECRERNRGLVWTAVTGYGRHSPDAHRPSTHPCAGAAAGGAAHQAGTALTASCDTYDELLEMSRRLVRANEANPDPNTSVVAASAILVALLHRELTGEGQVVHVNMIAANLYANWDDAVSYEGKPDRMAPDEHMLGLGALYRLYQTSDGWIFLAATSSSEWARFAEAAEALHLASDARFASASDRKSHGAALANQLETVFRTRSTAEWESIGVTARVAMVRADGATPGRFYATHQQVLDNDFSPEVTHARFGVHRRWGPIVTVDGGLASYRPGVLAGQHSDEILAELGLDAADLSERKIVSSELV